MTPFIIDSSILIDLHRTQPKEITIYAKLWKNLEDSMRDGDILISEEVYFELTRGEDDLSIWIKDMRLFYPTAFIESNSRVQQKVVEVMARCQSLVDPDSDKNHADPFLVAVGILTNGIVVCSESPRKQKDQRCKVPDACEEFGIKCIKYLDFAKLFTWVV